MPREPLFVPALLLCGGIAAGHSGLLSIGSTAWPVAAAAVLLLAAWAIRNLPLISRAALYTAFFAAGLGMQHLNRRVHTPKLDVGDGEVAILTGCVANPPVFSPDRARFTLELKPGARAQVSVNLRDWPSLPLHYGQMAEVTAKIRRPRNFGNPGAFDYAAYLAGQDVFWTASVGHPEDVRLLRGTCGNRATAAVFAVRGWALDRLRSLYPNDPHTSALLAATLLGETSGVEKRWTNDFRVTGTFHALVISGQHVSVLAGTLLALLALLGMRRLHALALAAVACWGYAVVSGFTAPVVRAAGAFTLFLVAGFIFRRMRVLNVLALVALIFLLLVPSELFDPSFQLSFLSALAIALFAVPLIERTTGPMRQSVKRFEQPGYGTQLDWRAAAWRVEWRLFAETIRLWTGLSERVIHVMLPAGVWLAAFVAEAVAISACVQFGLALPMISYFHRLSITGLTANVLVIPLLSGVVPLGFLAIATTWPPMAWATKLLLEMSEAVASFHASFEPAYRIAAIPVVLAVGFAASLIALAWVARKAARWSPLPLAMSLLLFALICWQPWQPELASGRLEVTAIDVGQGDSILVSFPEGETMLVDAGGFPGFGNMRVKPQMDIGEDVVSPYLWSRRIHRLDYAVLSHGHSDHMGGLPAILDNFHPKALWVGAEPVTDAWNDVARHAAADGTRIEYMHRGNADRHFGSAIVRVLAPASDYVGGESPHNNDSLVLEITYGSQRILLTGDAEQLVENELVASGSLHPVTLLKVGHHGSKTSSSADFLAALQPHYAFISDGYMNNFHHPHPSVMERLNEQHVKVFRTDLGGQARYVTDGTTATVSSYWPSR